MVKPKKPEIGVWKTVESKGHHKHQKEKPKPFLGDLPAKSNKQSNDAGRSRHPKHSRSTPRQQFHDRNRQRNNFPNSMPFPPHRSPIPMPCGSYYSMSCFYPSWYYNSCILDEDTLSLLILKVSQNVMLGIQGNGIRLKSHQANAGAAAKKTQKESSAATNKV